MSQVRLTMFIVWALIAATLLGACGGAEWAEFKSDAGGFAVSLPGGPTEETRSIPTAAGDIEIHTFTLESGTIDYAVGYFDFPAELADTIDPATLLSVGLEGAFGGFGGSITSQKDITLDGFPGIDAIGTYDSGGETGTMRARTYAFGARIFQVYAAHQDGDGNSRDIDKFFNSFRLTVTGAESSEPTPQAGVLPAATSAPRAEPSGPLGLTRSNPYPRSEVVAAPNWDVQVLDVVRGDPAWQALAATNSFNDPAPAGLEYLLVKLRVKSTYADNEEHRIGDADFDVTGDRRLLYSSALAVAPDPSLDANLRTGGESEGWSPYLVAQGEGNLILIVNELDNFDDDRFRFIALDEGAVVATDPALETIAPTDAGADAGNPAAQAETVVAEDWEISVLEVIRGDEAWVRLQEASATNDPPAEGMEYILARVRVRYIGAAVEAERIDSDDFHSTGSAGIVYDTPIVVNPRPKLEARLYPGGQFEGWITVQAASGETGVLIVFEPLFDIGGENTRYISIEP